MTRANSTSLSTTSDAKSVSDDPALDADHDSASSRLASRAGLRREAAAVQHIGGGGPASGATAKGRQGKAAPVTPDEQRVLSEVQTYAAVQASMTLAARRIEDAADAIRNALTTNYGEAGKGPAIEIVQRSLVRVRSEIWRLEREVAWTRVIDISGGSSLTRELGAIDRAFDHFVPVAQQGMNMLTQQSITSDAAPSATAQMLDAIHEHFDVKRTGQLSLTRHDPSEKSANELEHAALDEHIQAAGQTSMAMRINLTEQPAAKLTAMLMKPFAHMKGIQGLLDSMKNAKSLRLKNNVMMKKAIYELDQLMIAITKISNVPEQLKNNLSEFELTLRGIKTSIGI